MFANGMPMFIFTAISVYTLDNVRLGSSGTCFYCMRIVCADTWMYTHIKTMAIIEFSAGMQGGQGHLCPPNIQGRRACSPNN